MRTGRAPEAKIRLLAAQRRAIAEHRASNRAAKAVASVTKAASRSTGADSNPDFELQPNRLESIAAYLAHGDVMSPPKWLRSFDSITKWGLMGARLEELGLVGPALIDAMRLYAAAELLPIGSDGQRRANDALSELLIRLADAERAARPPPPANYWRRDVDFYLGASGAQEEGW
jgi:hypothetical protein